MPRGQRSRSARAIANDLAIRDAAVAEVLRVGVDHLSLRDVGHAAGLTHGATYARYEDVDELLVDLWNSVLSARVVNMFELCLRAAEEPSSETVGAVVDYVRDATPVDVASIHVLLSARRFPIVREEVEPFIQGYLERATGIWSDASATHTRATVVFGMTVVQIFSNSQLGPGRNYQATLEKLLLETLETDPSEVSEVRLNEPDHRVMPSPGEDLKTQLSFATFGVVGKSGYTRATISRIARRTGCSPGAIYKLYASKEELVIAALNDFMRSPWMSVSNFVDVLEVGSLNRLLSDAVSTKNSVRQSFNVETALASVQSDKLRAAILGQLREFEGTILLLSGISDDEKTRLRYLIRSIMYAILGVTFLATVTDSLEHIDFNQFAEPFRRAILKDVVPTWSEMCRQIIELVNRRGY